MAYDKPPQLWYKDFMSKPRQEGSGTLAIQTSLVAKRYATAMAAEDGVPRSVFIHRLIVEEYERRLAEKAKGA
jgi:hypothetical protein